MSDIERGLSLIEEAQVLQTAMPCGSLERQMHNAEAALKSLGSQAITRGELNRLFLVETRTAFSRSGHVKQGKHQIVRFESIAVEGRLQDFSYLVIGRLGTSLVSSICADFEEITMLPDGDLLPEGNILHIPVLAVEQAYELPE